MKNKIIKYCCLASLLFLLLIPIIKQHTGLLVHEFEVDELKGWFPPVDSAHFSIKNWWNGDFQNKKEAFLKRDLKVRPFAIRANNQMHYDILKEIRTDIIEGEDGYLFEKGYIEDLLGHRFIGEKRIKNQAEKLKFISEKLKKEKDVDVIVAVAISKALFHKDKLPKQYKLNPDAKTNYEEYLKEFKKQDIHVLDFNQYFLEQKEKTDHVLSPKYGIHWSQYAGMLAADSILNYIGQLKGKEVTPIIKKELVKSTEARKEDEDIGQSINLYRPLASENYSYFNSYLPFNAKKEYRPNIVLVGDSFSWTIWGNDIPHHLWGEETLFLYYYKEVWDTKWSELSGSKLKDEQIKPFAENADAIVLLFTPMNMNDLGSGFIDKTFEKLKDKD